MTNHDDARVTRTMSELDEVQILGRALRRFRREVANETAPELAALMDIPWGTLARLERGEGWPKNHGEQLSKIGFHLAMWSTDVNVSDETINRLTDSLTAARTRNAEMLRQGRTDKKVLEDALAETRNDA